MKELDKDLLKNHFELTAIYLQEFKQSKVSKKEFLKKLSNLNINTLTLLDI